MYIILSVVISEGCSKFLFLFRINKLNEIVPAVFCHLFYSVFPKNLHFKLFCNRSAVNAKIKILPKSFIVSGIEYFKCCFTIYKQDHDELSMSL